PPGFDSRRWPSGMTRALPKYSCDVSSPVGSDGVDHSELAELPSERPQGLQLGRGEAEQNLLLLPGQRLAVPLDGRADVPGLDRLVEYPREGLVLRVPLRGDRQNDIR